jgi:hypothetical protein
MKQNAKCIDVKNADGKLMFSLHLYDEETSAGNAGNTANGASGQEPQKNHSANGAKDSTAITEAQKRYLFRILADRGLEGDNAHRRLKERFGVDNLADVGKREASSMIEQLLEDAEAK